MTANSRQVGGAHYQSSYIHWDFVVRCGLGYLDGNATKYLARAGKKGDPAVDWEKADHYIEKLIETVVAYPAGRRPVRFCREEAVHFCNANNIIGPARTVIMVISTWETVGDLERAREILKNNTVTWAFPTVVPLSDSNKHAARVDDED